MCTAVRSSPTPPAATECGSRRAISASPRPSSRWCSRGLENRDPAPAPEILAEASAIARGRAVDVASLELLRDEFPSDQERHDPISARLDDVWDRWPTLLAALALLAAEWILRKRFEMV